MSGFKWIGFWGYTWKEKTREEILEEQRMGKYIEEVDKTLHYNRPLNNFFKVIFYVIVWGFILWLVYMGTIGSLR